MATRLNRFTILGSTAIGALAIAGGSAAFALGSSPSTTPSSSTILTQQAPSEAKADHIAALAAKLGISADALTAALKSVALDKVAEKEAAGEITSEQAASMRQRIEEGAVPFGPGGPRGGGHEGRGGPGGMKAGADVATFLGITQDQFRTELQGGKTLAQVAEAHGKSRDALKAFLSDAMKTKLAQAVTDGKLTQPEADAKLAEFSANLDARIDSVGKMGGGPRGPRGGAPSGQTQPSNVS
ncbi:MAG: hypothetical protein ACKVVT_06270 [Dehalococcoidia bacterium]